LIGKINEITDNTLQFGESLFKKIFRKDNEKGSEKERPESEDYSD
jgi:hypothetical protein